MKHFLLATIFTLTATPILAYDVEENICNYYCTKEQQFETGILASQMSCKKYFQEYASLANGNIDCCCENDPGRMPPGYEELAIVDDQNTIQDNAKDEPIEPTQSASTSPEFI